MTLATLLSNGDLKPLRKQLIPSGCRKYSYLTVESSWLYDYDELKEWLKTFLVYLD